MSEMPRQIVPDGEFRPHDPVGLGVSASFELPVLRKVPHLGAHGGDDVLEVLGFSWDLALLGKVMANPENSRSRALFATANVLAEIGRAHV